MGHTSSIPTFMQSLSGSSQPQMTQFIQAVRLVGRDVGDAEVSMAMCVRVLDRVETRSVVVPRDEYVGGFTIARQINIRMVGNVE
jgi:hypothetical protein